MQFKKIIAQIVIHMGGVSVLKALEAKRPNILRILAYHRIGFPEEETGKADPSLFSATPQQFEDQMKMIKEHYSVVGVEDIIIAVMGKKQLPANAVLITFDDAYLDFKLFAWPVLKCLELEAVLFVPTDYVAGIYKSFWWDRLYRAIAQTPLNELLLDGIGEWSLTNQQTRMQAFDDVKRLVKQSQHDQAMALLDTIYDQLQLQPEDERSCLNWQEIQEMVEQGLTIGAHTCSHPLLSRVPLEQARQEIVGSRKAIEQWIGRACSTFAYPSGHIADFAVELPHILFEEGFDFAVTMVEGHNIVGQTNPFLFNRLGMSPNLSLDELVLALTDVYNQYGKLKRLLTKC